MVMWTPVAVAWDAWSTGRGGRPGLEARQKSRLVRLVRYAREHSAYFADRYRSLPEEPSDTRLIPPMNKADMMDNFDRMVTEPEITREKVEDFVADHSRIGERFLGRYLVWLTSGTTGERGLVVQDRRALTVYMSVGLLRGLLTKRTSARNIIG